MKSYSNILRSVSSSEFFFLITSEDECAKQKQKEHMPPGTAIQIPDFTETLDNALLDGRTEFR